MCWNQISVIAANSLAIPVVWADRSAVHRPWTRLWSAPADSQQCCYRRGSFLSPLCDAVQLVVKQWLAQIKMRVITIGGVSHMSIRASPVYKDIFNSVVVPNFTGEVKPSVHLCKQKFKFYDIYFRQQ